MKKLLVSVLAAAAFLFVSAITVYWFNLDTKLVKALEAPMARHYDKLPRDRRL